MKLPTKQPIGSGTKDQVRRMTRGGIKKTDLPAAVDYQPQPAAVKTTVGFPPPIAENVGLASPLDMVITATVERIIPVPVGATEVIVEDASEFELTDADGNVFVVQSVTWPA